MGDYLKTAPQWGYAATQVSFMMIGHSCKAVIIIQLFESTGNFPDLPTNVGELTLLSANCNMFVMGGGGLEVEE